MSKSIDVSLGDVVDLLRNLKEMRDELRRGLRIEVPRELISGAVNVVIYPKFTDGYVVTVVPEDNEEVSVDVWLTHIRWGLEGRGVEWGDYRIIAGDRPVLEIMSSQGKVSIILERRLVEMIESMSNSAFMLHVMDWFISETATKLSGEDSIGVTDYSSLRFVDKFVEMIVNRLMQLREISTLREKLLLIERECSMGGHKDRARVDMVPVGTYHLCPMCRIRANKELDTTLNELRSRRISIDEYTWEAAVRGFEVLRDSLRIRAP